MIKTILFVAGMLTTELLHAADCNEACWVNLWCAGEIEVVLESGKRVDCLTDTHAIEADWDYKWAEAIGQSLYYAQETGLQPGVLLLLDGTSTDDLNLSIVEDTFNRAGISATIWPLDTITGVELPAIETWPAQGGCAIWGGSLHRCDITPITTTQGAR